MSIKTILVEDNKTIRDVLIPTMEELGGMEVMAVAETASEAVAAFLSLDGIWQLAVVDLFLRQGSGLDVLRACGGRQADRVVVVLSNYATPQMRERCCSLGADGVFDKSTQLDAFFDFCARRFQGKH
jgi:DNA-binding NarL/FixJ family response regulator